jgi:hypothetical protein
MSAPNPELLADLRRSKVDQARAMSPIDRLLSGPELFDYACETGRMGIRMQHPEFTAEQVERMLVSRLELLRERRAKRVVARG